LESTGARTAWADGADASVIVTAANGAGGAGRAAVEPGARWFLIATNAGDASGEIQIQARLSPRGAGAAALGDVISVKVNKPEVFASSEPLLFRLSGATAPARPAADFRFNRTERVRLEAPLAPGAKAVSGRVLDRAGKPLDVPVAISERDSDGLRWLVADVNLAPLYNGDYGVELSAELEGKRATIVTAIRVVR
jgi:hypothetical protein